MIRQKNFDDISNKVNEVLSQRPAKDLERTAPCCRPASASWIWSRAKNSTQQEVLTCTREKLRQMELRIAELEKQLAPKTGDDTPALIRHHHTIAGRPPLTAPAMRTATVRKQSSPLSIMNDPRIFLVHVIHHLYRRHGERRINLVNKLPHDRFRHAIVCVEDYSEQFRQRIQRPDVEVYAMHRSQIGSRRLRWRLWRLFRKLRPDIVHSRNMSGLDALLPARLAGCRTLHSEHGFDVDNPCGRRIQTGAAAAAARAAGAALHFGIAGFARADDRTLGRGAAQADADLQRRRYRTASHRPCHASALRCPRHSGWSGCLSSVRSAGCRQSRTRQHCCKPLRCCCSASRNGATGCGWH